MFYYIVLLNASRPLAILLRNPSLQSDCAMHCSAIAARRAMVRWCYNEHCNIIMSKGVWKKNYECSYYDNFSAKLISHEFFCVHHCISSMRWYCWCLCIDCTQSFHEYKYNGQYYWVAQSFRVLTKTFVLSEFESPVEIYYSDYEIK